MDSNKLTATILVLSLLAYSTFTEANGSCPPPAPKPTPPPTPKPSPTPPAPKPTPPTPKPSPTPPSPKATPPPTPTPKPCPTLTPPPPQEHCPKDTLKLGVCAHLLGLVNVIIGTPPSSECCALIKDLADLEAALCLCTAIKANVLGINLNVPITLSLILSACEKPVPPPGFQCP